MQSITSLQDKTFSIIIFESVKKVKINYYVEFFSMTLKFNLSVQFISGQYTSRKMQLRSKSQYELEIMWCH